MEQQRARAIEVKEGVTDQIQNSTAFPHQLVESVAEHDCTVCMLKRFRAPLYATFTNTNEKSDFRIGPGREK